MGAVSDAFIMSNWTRLKQWSLAIGVAIIGVALMSYLGIIDSSKSIYTGSRVLYLSLFVGSVLLELEWFWLPVAVVKPWCALVAVT
jgi:hypothetical protein